jgi:hypothetical protein
VPVPGHDPQDSGDVHFVVGSGAGGSAARTKGDAGPPHRSRRRADLRLRLTLAGGAAILALGTIVARASAGHHALERSTRTPSPRTSTSAVSTSPNAVAAVHAAFPDSKIVSTKSVVVFRDGHDRPSLLSRNVTARIPLGTLRVTVRRPSSGDASPGTTHAVERRVASVTANASTDGYFVSAELVQNSVRSDPASLLQGLANDPRLLAIR